MDKGQGYTTLGTFTNLISTHLLGFSAFAYFAYINLYLLLLDCLCLFEQTPSLCCLKIEFTDRRFWNSIYKLYVSCPSKLLLARDIFKIMLMNKVS